MFASFLLSSLYLTAKSAKIFSRRTQRRGRLRQEGRKGFPLQGRITASPSSTRGDTGEVTANPKLKRLHRVESLHANQLVIIGADGAVVHKNGVVVLGVVIRTFYK